MLTSRNGIYHDNDDECIRILLIKEIVYTIAYRIIVSTIDIVKQIFRYIARIKFFRKALHIRIKVIKCGWHISVERINIDNKCKRKVFYRNIKVIIVYFRRECINCVLAKKFAQPISIASSSLTRH